MQGPRDRIDEMKIWLQKTGSPASRIDQAVISNERDIEEYEFSDFSVHRE